jgi:D-alanyl-D-alanine carboxypeptidase
MPFGVWSVGRRFALGIAAMLAISNSPARAAPDAPPYLVADVDSGQVLIEHNSTTAWYPASLTKLMTVYVALDAVRAGKLTMDTPLVMSARAARMQPSKMGFRPGTEVTLDNALKMLMVKSPNDVAVMIAEGISGSVEAFADDMNVAGQRIGLHESHFVNPNGLHDPNHYSSARDMAIIARALLHEFPEHADLFSIGELQLGSEIIRNHNGLLGRYPGADGMKTGFTCPAGFNVVATANHSGRHLITVVLGGPSAKLRNQEAADLFDRGFAMGGGSGALDSLPSTGAGPTRSDICRHRSAALIAASEEENMAEPEVVRTAGRGGSSMTLVAASPEPAHTQLPGEMPEFQPVPVFVGPVAGWTGPVLGPRPAPSTAALPADAKAYTGEKASAVDAGAGPEPNASAVLKGAVRTPHQIKHHPIAKKVTASSESDKSPAKPRGESNSGKAAETAKSKPGKPQPKPASDQ